MISVEKQLSDYIHNCAVNGILSMQDISENLNSEISQLKIKLAEADPIRVQLSKLLKIQEKILEIMQTDKIVSTFEDDSIEMRVIRKAVHGIVGQHAPLSNRDIINKFMEINKDSYNDDSKIIRAIKFLHENEFLEKNADRNIIRGQKWDSYINDIV